jgi:hypothetical protein
MRTCGWSPRIGALTFSRGRTDGGPAGGAQPQRAGEDAPFSLERPDDLRAELNRRHAGEDGRVSLERARERRLNIEGQNLDIDISAVAPQTPRGARIQAGVPLAGVGCAALADHLRAGTWPSKFRPHLPEKYDGTSNPSEFLQVYVTAITAVGGDTAVMATYFHVALSGSAWTWLMKLTPGLIYSWEELYARFTANFASAYQQHGMEAHLHAVRQESEMTTNPLKGNRSPALKKLRKITTSFSLGVGAGLSPLSALTRDISRKYLPLILSR